MQISKWGDSLVIRLPKALIDSMGLKEGDDVEFHITDTRALAAPRNPDREDLLMSLRKYRGRMPADFKFDREEANARQLF